MKTWNSFCPGDGKNKLDARRYSAMLVSMCKETEKKRSFNMPQDSGNAHHNCESNCKKQRLQDRVDASRDHSPSVVEDSSTKALSPLGLNSLIFREYWVPVQLSKIQIEQYCSTLIANAGLLCSNIKKGNSNPLQEVLGALRKCCDHPYVLDSSLQSFCKDCNPSVDLLSIGIQASGKLQLLSKFLPEIRKQGLRVLIMYKTSETTTISLKNSLGIGHILDDFICQSFGQDSYVHIYTQRSVPQKEKQAAIDLFNDKTSGRFVVLTEYSSSPVSIRLSVDVVILFNSEWNPVKDIRVLQKMALHSQNDHMRVFRLYSVCSLEEKALCLARDGAAVNTRHFGKATSYMLLAWGAAYLFDKVDAVHANDDSESTKLLGVELFQNILDELSAILSSNVDDSSISCSIISKVKTVGEGYTGNVKLHGELEVLSLDDVPPHVFWSSLLPGKNPHWLLLPNEPEHIKRQLPYSERPLEIPEGGFKETILLHKEISGWSKGTSQNAKRSKRVPVSAARLQERLRKNKRGPGGTRDGHADISEHIQQVDETHNRRMGELLQKQKNEILEHIMTRESRRKSLERDYLLEKKLICELYAESLPKLNKLKKIDEKFKIKRQELSHEMDKCWGNLKAEQLSARTHEEDMRLKNTELLKKINAGSLSEDSEGEEIERSPKKSLNKVTDNTLLHDVEISPDNLLVEDLMVISTDAEDNALEDGEIHASPTLISSSVSPIQELSPRERLTMANDNDLSHEVEKALDNFPMEDMMVIFVDPDNTLEDGEICDFPTVISSPLPPMQVSSPGERLTMVNDSNLSHEVEISPDHVSMEDLVIPVDPDNNEDGEIFTSPTVASSSVPPLQESSPSERSNMENGEGLSHDVEISLDQKQVSQGLISSSVLISDDIEIFHQSTEEITVDEIGTIILGDMQNSEQSTVPSNTIGSSNDDICNKTVTIHVDFDDELHEASVVAPVGRPIVSIHVDSDDELHEASVVTPVGELIGTSSVLTQLPIAQPHLPPCQNVRHGDCSQPIQPSTSASPLRSDAFLLQTQTARATEGNIPPQLSDTTSDQLASLDPLQVELEKLNKAGHEAKKMHDDRVMHLRVSRDKELAQLHEKYDFLFQNAKNDFEQQRAELKLYYEKTRAHILLARACSLAHSEESPIDQIVNISSLVQSTGLPSANCTQTNAYYLSPDPINQNGMQLSSQLMNHNGLQMNAHAISPPLMNHNGPQMNAHAISPPLMNHNGPQMNAHAFSPQLLTQNGVQMNAHALPPQLLNQNGVQMNAHALPPQLLNHNGPQMNANALPPQLMNHNSMQTNTYAIFPQMMNQNAGSSYGPNPLYNWFCNPAGWRPYGQNPYIFPTLPFPTLSERHSHRLNFCSPGSSSQPHNVEEYQTTPYNIRI